MAYVRSAALTHPGRQRPNNEDFITFFEPIDQEVLRKSGCIYILADGVGGASKGERASQYAAQKILHDFYKFSEMPVEERLRTIIRQAGNDIYDYAEAQDNFMQMATTIVVAVVRNNTLQVAHVGDSRAYLVHEGQVIQLTRDHSTVGELMRDGLLTEDEAMHFDGRNPLSRSLGGQRDVPVDVSEPIKFSPGDKILLSSDGLTRYATRQNINDLLKQGEPEDVVYRMVDYANQSGGGDNVSVIIVEALDQVKAPPAARGQKPAPVDWETVPTISKDFIYKERKRFGNVTYARRKKTRKPAIVLAGICAVLLITAGLILGLSILNGNEPGISIDDSQISSDQSSPTLMEFINDQLETDLSPDVEPTPIEADLYAENSLAEANDVNGETQNPEPIDETIDPPMQDYAPEQTGWCEYTINLSILSETCSEQNKMGGCYGQYNPRSLDIDIQCVILCIFPDQHSLWTNDDDGVEYTTLIRPQPVPRRIGEGKLLWFPDITYRDCENAGGVFEVEDE
jgi:PPM family protein phosphatase